MTEPTAWDHGIVGLACKICGGSTYFGKDGYCKNHTKRREDMELQSTKNRAYKIGYGIVGRDGLEAALRGLIDAHGLPAVLTTVADLHARKSLERGREDPLPTDTRASYPRG